MLSVGKFHEGYLLANMATLVSVSKLATQILCAICRPNSKLSSMFGKTGTTHFSAWNVALEHYVLTKHNDLG